MVSLTRRPKVKLQRSCDPLVIQCARTREIRIGNDIFPGIRTCIVFDRMRIRFQRRNDERLCPKAPLIAFALIVFLQSVIDVLGTPVHDILSHVARSDPLVKRGLVPVPHRAEESRILIGVVRHRLDVIVHPVLKACGIGMRNRQVHAVGELVARIAAYAHLERGILGSLVFIPTQEAIAVGQLAVLGYSFAGYVEHLHGIRTCAIFCSLNLNVSFAHAVALGHIIERILLIALEHSYDVRHVVAVHRVEVGGADHGNLAAHGIEYSLVFQISQLI